MSDNPDLYADFMKHAEEMIPQHVVPYDNQQCFNLTAYIIALELWLEERLVSAKHGERRRFKHWELPARSIACYLWACIAIKETGIAWPPEFRGMPTLD